MSLTERIERQKNPDVQPQMILRIVSPDGTTQRKPAWLRRMEEKGLPAQDRTSYIHGAFTPAGSDGAA